jgi:hypothetical protein
VLKYSKVEAAVVKAEMVVRALLIASPHHLLPVSMILSPGLLATDSAGTLFRRQSSWLRSVARLVVFRRAQCLAVTSLCRNAFSPLFQIDSVAHVHELPLVASRAP